MELEVLLSIIDLDKKLLDKMNIKSNAVVINQCDKDGFEEYKNFKIFSYNERGLSKSRNRGLYKISKDIVILCDDDVIYNENYDKIILDEFEKNDKADIITFNIDSPNRKVKMNKSNKRLHLYNILRYTSCRIAFRRESIQKANIKFNTLFGAGAKYTNGEDSLFLVDALKNKLKIYSSTQNIGCVYQKKSTWFNGYNEKFFYDKGALFTAINVNLKIILIIQYLLRHKEILKEIKFFSALKLMIKGSNEYLKNNENI